MTTNYNEEDSTCQKCGKKDLNYSYVLAGRLVCRECKNRYSK